MPNNLLRKLISGVMPKGSVWSVKTGGFFDALLDALADSLETVKLKLSELADIRNAKKTTVLDELERDYGISFNPNLTEDERRAALDSRINGIDNTGSRLELEMALQRAGFPLFVYSNSPAVDPNRFTSDWEMTAGDENAFAGDENAIAGVFLAELVVNGDIVLDRIIYTLNAGDEILFSGDENAIARVESTTQRIYEYFILDNTDSWPFFFFVGGPAVFAVDGSIISIEFVDIDDQRRLELKEIILKYKPMLSWGIIQVNFV